MPVEHTALFHKLLCIKFIEGKYWQIHSTGPPVKKMLFNTFTKHEVLQ